MAFSRGLGVIGLVTVSWLVAVGCSDDDSAAQRDAQGGEAGESAAGAPTNGGKGGSGGKGGAAGGGTAGTSGDAGAGGEPPLVTAGAGAGGEAPLGGAAGAGGDGGAGGEPPVAAALKQCTSECEVSDDCLIGGSTDTFFCDPTTKRCMTPISAVVCAASDDCVAPVNYWHTCQKSEDCDAPDEIACVAWQGKGYCAYVDVSGCVPGEQSLELDELGTTDGTVTVCVGTAACYKGSCRAGCEANGCASEGEGSGNGDTCSEVTHLCECAAGDECSSGLCGADHVCAQCVTDADCVEAGIAGQDVCVDGRCGCSAASVCPDNTESATPVCE